METDQAGIILKNHGLSNSFLPPRGAIDIVIVNWNAGELIAKCVESLLRSEHGNILSNIIIVDNASTDQSLAMVPKDGKVKWVLNRQNHGFGAACNQGIELAKADFVVMVNPDVEVFPETLSQCLAFMHKNPSVDILGGMQLNEENQIAPSCSRFPKPFFFLYDALGLSKLLPKVFKPATVMTDFDHKTSRMVDQIMGSFMFIRRSVFEKIGTFDPRFFVYFEELDLSKRLAESGGRSYYNHEIKLVHHGGGTTQSVKGFRLYLSLNSRLAYSKKHFSRAGHIFTSMVTNLVEPLTRCAFLLLKGRIPEIKETINAYKRLWAKPRN